MKHIQQESNFNSLVLQKGTNEESNTDTGIFLDHSILPTTSSGTGMNWIIILERHHTRTGKSCIAHIYHHYHLLIQLCFQPAVNFTTPFPHRCLRATLQWIATTQHQHKEQSLMIFTQKPSSFNHILLNSTDIVITDIQQLLSEYGSFFL